MNKYLVILILGGIIYLPSYATPLTHCNNSHIDKKESLLLQELILQFANDVGCEPSNRCITQWAVEQDSANYSIAWKNQCGPVIGGEHQLGDNGLGSTFVCQTTNKQTCCWPMGYKYDYLKCS
jgi:hypothetical protein